LAHTPDTDAELDEDELDDEDELLEDEEEELESEEDDDVVALTTGRSLVPTVVT